MLVTLAHWAPRSFGPIDLRYDGGVYFVLGTSLAEGKGYRLLNEPGQIQAIQYPPLLPALVALLEQALGSSDPLVVGQALRWSYLFLSVAYALCALALARRFLAPWPAFLAALIPTLCFHTVFLEDLCFAEIPFALVTMLFVLALGAAKRSARALAWPLAAAAFLLRTAGIALLAAWVAEALSRKSWSTAALRVLASAAPVLLWQGHVSRVIHGPEYEHPAYAYQRAPYQYNNVSYAENVALLDPFAPEKGKATPAGLAWRLLSNLPRLPIGLGESVSAPDGFWKWPLLKLDQQLGGWIPGWPARIPIVLLGLLVLYGGVLLTRAGERFVPLYGLASLLLIALTPWPAQFSRYLAPLAPFLAIALGKALSARPFGWARSAAVVCWSVVLAVQLFTLRQTFTLNHHSVDYPSERGPVSGSVFFFDDAPYWRAFYASLGWLRANSEPEARVVSSAPHLVFLYARRQSVMPPLEVDVEEAQRLLDSVPADYVVVDDLRFIDISRRYAEPVMRAHPELWEPVYREARGGLVIYRRKR